MEEYEFGLNVTGQTFKAMAIDSENVNVDVMKFNVDVIGDLVKLTQFLEKWKDVEVKIFMV